MIISWTGHCVSPTRFTPVVLVLSEAVLVLSEAVLVLSEAVLVLDGNPGNSAIEHEHEEEEEEE